RKPAPWPSSSPAARRSGSRSRRSRWTASGPWTSKPPSPGRCRSRRGACWIPTSAKRTRRSGRSARRSSPERRGRRAGSGVGGAGEGGERAPARGPRKSGPIRGTSRRTAMPDPTLIRPYLEDRHVELAERVADFCARSIAPLPEPDHDDAARARARELLAALGRAGWFEPIAARDLRALCLIREALAYASPLADAVFALQALSVTPMLLAAGRPVAAPSGSSPGDVVHAGSGAPSPLAGSAAAGEPDGGPGDAAAATSPRDRWAPAALRGAAMGAFAMTEPDAGSDVAALRTTARRDGDHYVLNGVKTFSSNAGIADFYTVFASTDPERRGRG